MSLVNLSSTALTETDLKRRIDEVEQRLTAFRREQEHRTHSVPLSAAETLADIEREVIELSVRPEKIEMTTVEPNDTDRCVVRGVVTEVVYLGTSTNYNIATSAGAQLVVFDQNAANAEDIAARGDSVYLTWNPQHSYPIGA